MELLDYEKKHIEMLEKVTSECTLFLNRNERFPLKEAGRIVLVGSGVRNTIKGGTGSGDVNSRFFKNIESEFEEAGFEIVSKDWLDFYDVERKTTRKKFIKRVSKEAYKLFTLPIIYQMGYHEEEHDYDFPLDYDTDTAIYVLSRNSGEGNDRHAIKGDVLLTDTEVRDILYLDSHYKHFMLVLNVGGVVDLEPVKDVSNILLLSQLGVLTSKTLVDIVLGKKNPSGKLSTTWARYSDYQTIGNFGDRDDTYYNEGIYVGYRYFDSYGVSPLYPFGYGKSYTDFSVTPLDFKLDDGLVSVQAEVLNTGKFSGKEVVEVYVSDPIVKCPRAYQRLMGFSKTKELKPGESEVVTVEFKLEDMGSFCEHHNECAIAPGKYIVRVGDSSRNTKPAFFIEATEKITLKKLSSKLKGDIENPTPLYKFNDNLEGLKSIMISSKDVKTKEVNYEYSYKINPIIKKMSNEDLAEICTGHHVKGKPAIVGESSDRVFGAAGETTLQVKELSKSLCMSDGPAGIRVITTYGKDEKGTYNITMDKMTESFLEYLPGFVKPFLDPSKSAKKRHGEIINQYTTAIPIGTALAQSFSKDVLYTCGDIIGSEMDKFDIDLWLAPALNIHRSILCGRNFEYYSEDPLLSGLMAAYITKGVQAHKGRGVTIKHFACNNQEFNRNNNNSHLSEKTLREIYLKGFEIAIRESNPLSIMTSYNFINGVHASESYELCTDILRSEWNYKGLVMTDWIESGRTFILSSKYKAPYASNNIKAGNDLTMPGATKDTKDILKALKKGTLTREELELSSSRIFDFVMNFK